MTKENVKGYKNIKDAKAVFTDDFQFAFDEIPADMPYGIEEDRLIMSNRAGMMRKLFGLRRDEKGTFSGGYYLFDTVQNAKQFQHWVNEEFVTDGVKFFDRPVFLEPSSQVWEIVEAEDFKSVTDAQKVVRYQRWHVPEELSVDDLRQTWWPKLKEAALAANLASAWLLLGTDEKRPQFSILVAADGEASEADKVNVPSIQNLEKWVSVGDDIATALKGTKVFDRTSWLYMIWHHVADGDETREAGQWPLSPPLPGLNK